MSHILFLKDVYIDECKDVCDIMEDRLAEIDTYTHSVKYRINNIVYDKIPNIFTTVDTWPKSTNIPCWACDCQFQWASVFIPVSIVRDDILPNKHKPIEPDGNFCSLICALEHIINTYPKHTHWEKIELLKMLHKIITGIYIYDIPRGHKKTRMVKYGGDVSVDVHFTDIKTLCIKNDICYPPGLFTHTFNVVP